MINNELINKIEKYLNDVYDKSSHRLLHINNVKKTAVALGEYYNLDIPTVTVAALLHDVTKKLSKKENLRMIGTLHPSVPKACYHAYSATELAKTKFNIQDQDILNAIKYHCSGRANMSLLEKVIYVSDFIEEGREFCPEDLRTLVFEDLDQAVYKIMIRTRNYILKHNEEFSSLTQEAIDNYETNRRI